MKRFFLLYFVHITLFSCFAQKIVTVEQFKIEQVKSNVFLDFFNRINSKNDFIIPLIPIYEENNDSINFLFINKNYMATIKKWKIEKKIIENEEYLYGGLSYNDNSLLLMFQSYLYEITAGFNGYKTKKIIKMPKNLNLNEIHFINYPNKDYVLLANTYNFSNKDKPHNEFILAKYNINKQKIDNLLNIDIGKGILLCYFSFQWISTTKSFIAVANPIKPEIYCFNNNLEIIDTIKIPYPEINKTGNLLDSILNNAFLEYNKYNPKIFIDKMNEYEIYKKTKIEKIAFIDDDLLFILIQSENPIKNEKLHFIYSLSNRLFLNNNGINSNYIEINSSEPIIFIDNQTINIIDSIDDNDNYKYYATFSKIIIKDSIKNFMFDTLKLPLKTNLEYYKPTDSIKNNSKYLDIK